MATAALSRPQPALAIPPSMQPHKKQSKRQKAVAAPADVSTERRKVPSWMVSFIVHLLGILILAIIPMRELVQGPLTLFLGDSGPVGIAEFELSATADAPTAESTDEPLPEVEPLTATDLLRSELTELVKLPTVAEMSEISPPTMENIPFGLANGLSGRTGRTKAALLKRFGGTAATEDAVEMGLAWLVEQQKSDGAWSLRGPYSNGGANENTTAATAMALNAFLGAGYTAREGKYSNEIRLGIKYLLKKQDADGFFAKREPERQQMYAQALASITILEAYGMTGDSELRTAAEAAVRFAEWSQSDLRGWRYQPREDADVSVTGWFVMVMATAKMCGLAVDEEKFQSVNQFLDSVSHDDNSRYAYTPAYPASLGMTAEGLLCRIILGWSKSERALLTAIEEDLLPTRPSGEEEELSVYYWYYATQVLHHVGGRAWDVWNDDMKRVLPDTQVKSGPEKGSWDPARDLHEGAGGRLYTTCLRLYCLEVYYRHLSIYDLN